MRRIAKSTLLVPFLLSLPNGALAQSSSEKQAAFDRFTSHYYEAPQPERAPEMLHVFLTDIVPSKQDLQQDTHSLMLAAYFFGRLGVGHSHLVRQYEALFATSPPVGRLALLEVLRICGDEITRTKLQQWQADPAFQSHHSQLTSVRERLGAPMVSPLSRETATPADLDLLWMEFFLTGDPKPIRKLLDVVDRPDHIRQRLDQWLTDHPEKPARAQMEKLFGELDITYDPSTNRMMPGQDLDVHCARILQALAGKSVSEPFTQLKRTLNFSDQEVVQMAIKGVASWALGSNAQQHPRLVQLCEEELTQRTGGSRVLLLRISAASASEEERYLKAVERLTELIQLTPDDPVAHEALGQAYLELGKFQEANAALERLLQLVPTRTSQLEQAVKFKQIDLAAVDQGAVWRLPDEPSLATLKRASEGMRRARGYRSQVRLTDLAKPQSGKNGVVLEWHLEHVAPNRFVVEQIAWSDNVADKWLSAGDDHYAFFGFWMKMNEEFVDDMAYPRWNSFLKLDKYVELMRESAPTQVADVVSGDRTYLLASYEPTRWDQFGSGLVLEAPRYRATLWINRVGDMMEKAVIYADSVQNDEPLSAVRVDQFVVDYNADITIQKPEALLNMPN